MKALRGLLSLLFLLSLMASMAHATQRVLVLQSYSPGFSRSTLFEGALHRALEEVGRKDLHLDFEYLDAQRHPEAEYLDLLGSTIVAKHGSLEHFDLVVVVDDPAMDFLIAHLPGADLTRPVVAVAVSEGQRKRYPFPERLAWIEENPPVEATVNVAMHLLPHTERVYVLCDTISVGGRALLGALQEGTRELAQRIPVEFLYTCTALENIKRPNSWVLYGWCSRDFEGQLACSGSVLHQIRDTLPQPLFSPFPHYMGHGIVGGVMTSEQALARSALVLMERSLSGETAGQLSPIRVEERHAIFDYPSMLEHGLHPGKLPEGSVLRNQPTGMLMRYRQWAWWGALVIILQGVIIAAQITVKRVRRETQREVEQSEQALREVIDLVPHVIMATNAEGRILLANRAAARLFKLKPSELVGHTRVEVFHDPDQAGRSVQEDATVLERNEECVPLAGYLHGCGWSGAHLLDGEGSLPPLSRRGRPRLCYRSYPACGGRARASESEAVLRNGDREHADGLCGAQCAGRRPW